jgi:hypothetical protein
LIYYSIPLWILFIYSFSALKYWWLFNLTILQEMRHCSRNNQVSWRGDICIHPTEVNIWQFKTWLDNITLNFLIILFLWWLLLILLLLLLFIQPVGIRTKRSLVFLLTTTTTTTTVIQPVGIRTKRSLVSWLLICPY